jgi:hypothetical protein
MATDLPNWTIPTSIKDIAVPLPNAQEKGTLPFI